MPASIIETTLINWYLCLQFSSSVILPLIQMPNILFIRCRNYKLSYLVTFIKATLKYFSSLYIDLNSLAMLVVILEVTIVNFGVEEVQKSCISSASIAARSLPKKQTIFVFFDKGLLEKWRKLVEIVEDIFRRGTSWKGRPLTSVPQHLLRIKINYILHFCFSHNLLPRASGVLDRGFMHCWLFPIQRMFSISIFESACCEGLRVFDIVGFSFLFVGGIKVRLSYFVVMKLIFMIFL